MTKKLIIILSFCFLEFLLSTHSILAVTATPSATPTQDLQEKIKNLVRENLDSTESQIQKDIATQSLLGFTGKVKSIGSKNLTLEVDNDLLQVAILPATKITKAGAEIKSSSIAMADKILIFGIKNKDSVLQAKVITVLAVEDENTLVITKSEVATIKNIDLKKKTFVLVIGQESVPFTLSKKTTVKLEDLKDGDTLFAITKKYQGKFSLSRAIKI